MAKIALHKIAKAPLWLLFLLTFFSLSGTSFAYTIVGDGGSGSGGTAGNFTLKTYSNAEDSYNGHAPHNETCTQEYNSGIYGQAVPYPLGSHYNVIPLRGTGE